jgi:hypothetical protein
MWRTGSFTHANTDCPTHHTNTGCYTNILANTDCYAYYANANCHSNIYTYNQPHEHTY